MSYPVLSRAAAPRRLKRDANAVADLVWREHGEVAAAKADIELKAVQASEGIGKIRRSIDFMVKEALDTLRWIVVVDHPGSGTIATITYAWEAPDISEASGDCLQFTWDPARTVTAFMSPLPKGRAGHTVPAPRCLGSVSPTEASENWARSMFAEWLQLRASVAGLNLHGVSPEAHF